MKSFLALSEKTDLMWNKSWTIPLLRALSKTVEILVENSEEGNHNSTVQVTTSKIAKQLDVW